MTQQQEAQRLVNLASSMIKTEDIFHRGFLKPIEIALKTYKTQMFYEDCTLKPGCLPAGLKIAVNSSPESQKRVLQDIEQINEQDSFFQLRQKNQDNMLALMKRKKGIQLLICVCMYSQTKHMLKNTLAGISDNIANIVAYEGVDPDDIAVVVVMDGIQHVDESIIRYFEELEKSSNINLGDNIAPSLTVEQLQKRANQMTQQEINQVEMKNVNNFLFDPAQLDQRNGLRFQSISNQYRQIKNLSNTVKELNKRKALYHDLPPKAQEYFIEQAKRQRRKDYSESEEDVNRLATQVLLEQYASDINQARPLVAKALQKTAEFCSSYFSNKQDLSYLSYFRKKVYYDYETLVRAKHNPQQKKDSESHHLLNQEEQNVDKPNTFMNLFLCTKYKNAGKLSSHNWFFNGFCKELTPQYAVLLDVGLKTEGTALMKMYSYMKSHPNVGGVCGYMSLKMQRLDESEEIKDEYLDCISSCFTQLVDIQRTQQVEYHFAHLMDKPFEAAFGFIHVLPGAFSAYNMKAIVKYNGTEDDELLKNYFKSISEKLADRKITTSRLKASNVILRTALPDFINRCCVSVDEESDQAMLYNENVYLAEDRILCMGIHKQGFELAFLPDAYAEVDPMKTVHGLLGQRKRWINGSFFAFDKVKKELSAHEKKNGCEIFLNMQIFYLSLMNAFAYLAPAFFMFTMHIAMFAFRIDVLERYLGNTVGTNALDYFVYTMDFIYALMVVSVVFFSLNFKNTSKYFIPLIYTVSTVMGIFIWIIMFVLIVDIIRGLLSDSTYLANNLRAGQQANIDLGLITLLRYLLVGSVVINFIPLGVFGLIFCKGQPFCQVLLGYLSFLFYTPTYLIVLSIYSLCKIDDISWGTKGLDSTSPTAKGLAEEWRLLKFVHIAKYVIWNIILASVLLTLGEGYATKFWVTFGMVCLIGSTMAIKVFVGIFYFLVYKCRSNYTLKEPKINVRSRIDNLVNKFEDNIMEEVTRNLENIKHQYINTGFKGSFIQASRTNRNINISLKNQSIQQKQKSMVSRRSPVPNNPSQKRNNLGINRNIPEETSPGSSQNLTNSPDGEGMHLKDHKADKNKYKNAKATKK